MRHGDLWGMEDDIKEEMKSIMTCSFRAWIDDGVIS